MGLYDRSQWKKLRTEQLRVEPFCVFCKEQGRIVPAAVVDHIQPHRGDESLFFDPANLQSLCKLCHDAVKQRFEKSGVITGGNQCGIPLDPNHHWNRS